MTQAQKRSSLVGVRFLPEEKQKLQELALEQHQTLSELIRANALKPMERRRKLVPEMNRTKVTLVPDNAEKTPNKEIEEQKKQLRVRYISLLNFVIFLNFVIGKTKTLILG